MRARLRIGAGLTLLVAAACSKPFYVGTDGALAGTSRAPPPEAPAPVAARGATPPGLTRKVVAGKEPPSTLVARDGSRCTVGPARFDETRVGDRVACTWRSADR